ncbi:hypothetical protein [Nioella aestuarii]|uniref:hypothetical protein n=1 Tax=Nioella aestuarii TaxID=1662864 RepID=UPI003D7FBAB3
MTLIIIIWVVFGAVGAVIDGIRGFLWGFILGPVGWIIAAILKSKSQDQETHTTTSSHSITRDSASRVAGSSEEHHQDNGQFDRRRWEILKEVDQDIRQASEAVVKVHPSLDDELAEKYMVLNQKEYLQALVDKIV